jgi:hypothetical protein
MGRASEHDGLGSFRSGLRELAGGSETDLSADRAARCR